MVVVVVGMGVLGEGAVKLNGMNWQTGWQISTLWSTIKFYWTNHLKKKNYVILFCLLLKIVTVIDSNSNWYRLLKTTVRKFLFWHKSNNKNTVDMLIKPQAPPCCCSPYWSLLPFCSGKSVFTKIHHCRCSSCCIAQTRMLTIIKVYRNVTWCSISHCQTVFWTIILFFVPYTRVP